jgi:hypothetical protein
MTKLRNYQKQDLLNPKITVEELQNIKSFLPFGILKKIAAKCDVSESTVSNTFNGKYYNLSVAYVAKCYAEKYNELYATGNYEPR